MTDACMMQSELLAQELYAFLRTLDPAAWRDDLESISREKLEELRQRLAALLQHDEWVWEKPSMAALREKLATLSSHLNVEPHQMNGEQLRAAWNQFRVSVVPAYEGLAQSLKKLDIHVPSLRPTNYARNVLHICSGLSVITLIRFVVPEHLLLTVAASAAAMAWTLEITRRMHPAINRACMWVLGRFAHPHENWRINSASWYTTALLGLALVGQPMLAAVAVSILAFADPAAALVGRRYGTLRLINGRSAQGSAAFVVVGAVVSMMTLTLLYQVALWPGVALSLAAVLPAAVAELLCRRVDDNLAIPLSAAAGGWLALLFLA